MAKQKIISLIPDKVRKPSGLKNNGLPNSSWRKFEDKINSYESIPVQDWNTEELLGHIIKRYKTHYGVDFALSYSGAPSKCGEIYCIRRMMFAVGSEKGEILKNYIDWVFDKIIIGKKVQLTSLAFFFTKKICDEFRAQFRKNNVIAKTTELPISWRDIIKSLDLDINTYGDLAFTKMAIESDPTREDIATYNQLFQSLRDIGLDDNLLTSIQDT